MSFKSRLRQFLRTFLRVTNSEIHDTDLEYLLWITSLYNEIRLVPGHIAEVGVAAGRNTVLFGKLIKLFNDTNVRQYVGFDTFDGYLQRDLKRDSHLNDEVWKGGIYTKEAVENRCGLADVLESVELFKGDATDTVPLVLSNHQGKLFQPGKSIFSLLYIDCNAYEPAISSMRNFYQHMANNSIIAIDEKLQGGETEALIDFAQEKKQRITRQGPNSVPMMIKIEK